jgi:CHASE2 domain-containing sensor protein
VHRSSRVPTIAFAAARLYDSTIENQALLKGTENPFTSFISEGLFHPIESSEVLSGSFDVRQLQRKIVLIGDGMKDMHESVVGRVPGVVLQANYIESLLDERYFTGQGPLAGTVAALICIAIIAAIFDKASTAHRGLFRSGFFLLLLMFVSYIALVHFATLFTFWVPGLLAIGPAYLAKWHSLRLAGDNNAIRIKSVKTTNEREDLVANRPASNYQHR